MNECTKKWTALVPSAPNISPPIRNVNMSNSSEEGIKMQNAGLTFIPTNKPNVMAFEINGVVTEKELPGELEKFSAFLHQYEKVRMLARFKHFVGFEPTVLLHSGGLISVKLAAVKKLERYAVVGAPDWMTKLVSTMNMFFPEMEIRWFSKEDESKAWSWIEANAS